MVLLSSLAAVQAFTPRSRHSGLLALLSGSLLLPLVGCAVPQPRGDGKLAHITEPASKRAYYLYLPKEYVQADEAERSGRSWPLVVTFHGMKPYDVAYFQAREWQQEADRYGYIVIAPELKTFDFLFGEFPLRRINNALKEDERATLAIMEHVFESTHADPSNVLSTGFSSGGYIAHYMLNRHPEKFTALAARQADFCWQVLDSNAATRSLYHPVLILGTENDLAICKEESKDAIKWYETHGYKNFAWVHMSNLGHERTPDTAADFFARVCGVQPNRPPEVLIHRQAIDGNTTGLALLAGNLHTLQRAPRRASFANADEPEAPQPRAPTQRRPVFVAAEDASKTAAPAFAPALPPPPPTPRRDARAAGTPAGADIGISLSSAVGFSPLLVVFSAECPADWYKSAQFRWTLNGKAIADAVNGQRTLAEPGDYDLELLVVAPSGTEHRAARQIRVLRDAGAAASVP